ncbi:DUF4651 domain-containing protein [Streptococcus loxodontisalivarius]|uniref:DUF4651 domain-containing protein n=1 Tax=Streptococcus loxodontisalivarius TaxID=1349415 RepID=A0ABS2PUJ4_9STRE|nr:DUF4651 domain-containing protein [Streptococcus loxodontisalivarius]MBM7643551.1 hypothetical protein [Streptococcus loxodontisalivarius]
MKRKNLVLLASGLAGLGLLTWSKARKDAEKALEQETMMRQVRSYFSQKGPIQVVYVNAYDKLDEATTGGVVLEDGRRFDFTYFEGDIISKEVDHD